MAARERVVRLAEFEAYVKSLTAPEGGSPCTSLCMYMIATKATDLDLTLHPVALEAEVAKHLNFASLRKLQLADSLRLPSDRTFYRSYEHYEAEKGLPFAETGKEEVPDCQVSSFTRASNVLYSNGCRESGT